LFDHFQHLFWERFGWSLGSQMPLTVWPLGFLFAQALAKNPEMASKKAPKIDAENDRTIMPKWTKNDAKMIQQLTNNRICS
jgi:hypothetical protein